MKLLLPIVFILAHLQLSAQLASYNFNTNLQDDVNNFHATPTGTTEFKTDNGNQVIELDGDGYLTLPQTLTNNINVEEGFEYTIKFKVTDDYRVTTFNGHTNEGSRVLVTNKGFDQREGGFNLYIGYWDGEYKILATYGDGIQNSEGYPNEGQIDFVADAEIGVWYTVTVKMVLNSPQPYIQYLVNGNLSTSFIDAAAFNFQLFKNTLSSKQIWVGTDQDNNMRFDFTPFSKVSIDDLVFYSPFPPGNPTIISTVLSNLISSMNGNTTLTTAQQEALFVDFINNWDNGSFAPNQTLINNYLSVFSNTQGTVFDATTNLRSMNDFSVVTRIQYILEQWILDNLYTSANISNMGGISFLDHTLFPGPVTPNAPRVTTTTFKIDGTYKTNPGYKLNDQAFAIRPTGYYAPAGELVTITIPTTAINRGLKVRIGAHFANLEETWNQFNRFPRMGTEVPIENITTTVANPFGGAIYIILPDGTTLGALNCQIAGAVKAPYYCTKSGFETAISDYQTDLANNYVPWTDWESANTMITFPTATAKEIPSPIPVLKLWDDCFDVYNRIGGRPAARIRSEYLLLEKQNHNAFTIPASYPMSFPINDFFTPTLDDIPYYITNPTSFIPRYNTTTIFHEMGHLHNFPTLFDEIETIAELPSAAIFNIVFDLPISEALNYSTPARLDQNEAALDWILTPPFRLGYRMHLDTFNYPVDHPFTTQLSYQARGYAKYVDIAELFSWNGLGLVNSHFYEEALGNPAFDYYDISDDTYLKAATEALGVNMLPLFEFWGILPSPALVNELSTYPCDNKIKNKLLHYRSIVPSNAQEFQVVYDAITATIEPGHKIRYDKMLPNYTRNTADSIVARIDLILNKYFDQTCTNTQNPAICSENIVTIPTATQDNYHAIDKINSTASITGSVTYKAGNEIHLLPGFHAQANSTFLATIEACPAMVTDEQPTLRKIDNQPSQPQRGALTIYPNPFYGTTNFQFELTTTEDVSLVVFNQMGQLMKPILVTTSLDAGIHILPFEAEQLASGIYWVRLTIGDALVTKKIVLENN